MIDIKIDCERQTDTKICMVGSATTIIAELAFVLNRMHCTFHRHGERIGENFRRTVTDLVTDDDSPLWQLCDIDGEVTVLMKTQAEKKENPGQEGNS